MDNKVHIPYLNKTVGLFTPREKMKKHRTIRRYKLYNPHTNTVLPIAQLPIDWTKNNTLSFPMDDNDQDGDCFYAASEHQDNTWTGCVGTQSTFDDTVTLQRYLALSGGDNGLDEGQITEEWLSRGLSNIPEAKIIDYLDVDPTNAPLVASAMFEFGGVSFQLALPDPWIQKFGTGYLWDAGPGIHANPNNGHAILWNGINNQGFYKLQTWGTYGWITPAGVAICDPTAFVCFSVRWFNPKTGYAPNGRHISQSAQLWKQAGGKTIPDSVISAFPPASGPTPLPPGPPPIPVPPPGPTPPGPPPVTGPTLAQAQQAVAQGITNFAKTRFFGQMIEQAVKPAVMSLIPLWPSSQSSQGEYNMNKKDQSDTSKKDTSNKSDATKKAVPDTISAALQLVDDDAQATAAAQLQATNDETAATNAQQTAQNSAQTALAAIEKPTADLGSLINLLQQNYGNQQSGNQPQIQKLLTDLAQQHSKLTKVAETAKHHMSFVRPPVKIDWGNIGAILSAVANILSQLGGMLHP